MNETHNGKILVIDDLAYDVTALKMILEHAGYQVSSAENGEQGLKKCLEIEPDGILLDIQLPDMDGFEICRRLKEDARTTGIPVVFLTAHYHDEASLIRGLNLGANDYINKPFNKEELLARVGVMVRIRRSQENLLKLSLTDELTGLGNRRFLLTRLEEEFERCRRAGNLLSCFMLDIDHFKLLNDTYGHQYGDRVLKELSEILREQMRKADVVGRYGGEEFLVVLAVNWKEEALRVAERIRRAVAETQFESDCETGENVLVTVSLGVAECLPAEQDSPPHDELIRRADQALYEAKRLGRNRVCHWTEEEPAVNNVEPLVKPNSGG